MKEHKKQIVRKIIIFDFDNLVRKIESQRE